MITIKVPATSANMGPGFDSLGLAVNLYLELDILEEAKEWSIRHDLPFLPRDKRNLIIKVASQVNPKIRPHKLAMRTNIPTTRGLGSSSSAIVAGIELANYLGKMNLSVDQKIQLATKFEGHPDNVAPAITGNMVASVYMDDQVNWSKIKLYHMMGVACIPKKPLSTKESRGVLPKTLTLAQAAQASAVANVLMAQLARGYYKHIKKLIEKDQFHEPYRHKLVPEVLTIRHLLRKEWTYGTYLSGAGPTVMTLVPPKNAPRIKAILEEHFPNHDTEILRIETQGSQVIEH